MAAPHIVRPPEDEGFEQRLAKVETAVKLFQQWRAIEFGVWAVLIAVLGWLLVVKVK